MTSLSIVGIKQRDEKVRLRINNKLDWLVARATGYEKNKNAILARDCERKNAELQAAQHREKKK